MSNIQQKILTTLLATYVGALVSWVAVRYAIYAARRDVRSVFPEAYKNEMARRGLKADLPPFWKFCFRNARLK